jgi:hypothetical protein
MLKTLFLWIYLDMLFLKKLLVAIGLDSLFVYTHGTVCGRVSHELCIYHSLSPHGSSSAQHTLVVSKQIVCTHNLAKQLVYLVLSHPMFV